MTHVKIEGDSASVLEAAGSELARWNKILDQRFPKKTASK